MVQAVCLPVWRGNPLGIGDTNLHRCFRRGRSPDFLDGCSESTLRDRNPSWQRSDFQLNGADGLAIRPLGDSDWLESITSRLNLESTIRPRGSQQTHAPHSPIKET